MEEFEEDMMEFDSPKQTKNKKKNTVDTKMTKSDRYHFGIGGIRN